VSTPRLRQNIVALGAVQVGSYLVPLVTLPYLTRILGPEGFGRVALVLAGMSLLMLLVDYGFSWSATREIAANRTNRQRVSAIFAGTWAAQWWLLVGAGVMLSIVVAASSSLRTDVALYAVGFLQVFGNVLFPMWLFQGLEQLRTAALIQLSSRVATLPLVFLLVHSPDDLVGAVAFYALGPVLGGILAIAWLIRTRTIGWQRPDSASIVGALRVGADVFIGKAAVAVYTAAVPLVLGALAGPSQVGYFALADRARNLAQSMLMPISQALFPRLSFLFQNDAPQGRALLRRSAVILVGIAATASALVFALAEPIVQLLAGGNFATAVMVMRWMAFVPLVVAISNLLGVQVMLPKGMHRQFSIILVGGALLSIVLMHPLISSAQAVGAAQLVLAVESAVAVAMFVYLVARKRRKERA